MLKQLLIEERQERDSLAQLIERILEEAAAQLATQAVRHETELKAAIQALLRRYYGPRCESFDPRQLLLFGQIVDTMPLDVASVEAEAGGEKLVTHRVKNRHNHGRRAIHDRSAAAASQRRRCSAPRLPRRTSSRHTCGECVSAL